MSRGGIVELNAPGCVTGASEHRRSLLPIHMGGPRALDYQSQSRKQKRTDIAITRRFDSRRASHTLDDSDTPRSDVLKPATLAVTRVTFGNLCLHGTRPKAIPRDGQVVSAL